MKEQLELFRIFDATSSFKYFLDTKILSNEPKFNGSYARNNFPKIKDATYVTNLDEYADFDTHWIALHSLEFHSNGNAITYFDSFWVKHVAKEIKTFINVIAFKGYTIATNILE